MKCDAVEIKSQNLISKYRYKYIYRVPDNKYNIAHIDKAYRELKELN